MVLAPFDLVRDLCRPDWDPQRPLHGETDWHALLALAGEHDLLPLVSHRLSQAETRAVPAELRDSLAVFNDRQRRRTQGRGWQLQQVLHGMNGAAIPVIALKGPLLGRRIYGEAWLRSIRDLDILVRQEDVDRTLDLLASLGYAHDPNLDARAQALLRRYAGQYLMLHPSRAPVEPHWLLAPRTLAFGLDHHRMWQDARPTVFRGEPCLELSPEDTLLALCLHGAKDRWQSLKHVVDVAFFLDAHPHLAWDRLADRAAAEGCRRVLGLGLRLAHSLLGASVPAEMGDDRTLHRLADRAADRLRRDGAKLEGPYTLCGDYWAMHERPRDRWAYAVRTALAPRPAHYQRLKLPERLTWAYSLLKLPWDYGLTPLLGLLRRRSHAARA